MSDRVQLVQDLQCGSTADSLFVARVIDRGLAEVRSSSWATPARALTPIGEPVHRSSGERGESALYEQDGVLLQASLYNGWVHVRGAGDDRARIDDALARVKEFLPPPDPSSTHRVPVTFWTYGPHGPIASSRSISVPEWSEIEGNYGGGTREQLDALMRRFEPAHGGQLVLWHGKVGTGKTFALRALAWEWRDWCEFHYIVDPDSFFGERADYLMGVLTQPGYAEIADPRFMHVAHMRGMSRGDVDADGDGADDEPGSKAWRLLVLEDTGELLTPDAKSIIGQGLSRFLNVVDGLIGQGLRVLVLVTTNEEIRTLHPAVSRPGRCAANIEFMPLSREEAAGWAAEHGGVQPGASATLASLYARLEGRDGRVEAPAGFAG